MRPGEIQTNVPQVMANVTFQLEISAGGEGEDSGHGEGEDSGHILLVILKRLEICV